MNESLKTQRKIDSRRMDLFSFLEKNGKTDNEALR